ncbi:GAF domain-containing DNA-binding protein [Emticicia sp. BO119]|uniref:GAF domain-containing DNA-binding protein n=1 Tax=Emticicia sp. BO119 TaxID=2757768 RepID=UPI0015F0A7A1|nr:LytTR family transcriptional regulator DNA-binding domain-containing protein [Emticicia sp. BO119]MBA4850748.1 LytTR family transcriptional regulator DNA-binding domain-containing protein [Emticicia sp. BO119]
MTTFFHNTFPKPPDYTSELNTIEIISYFATSLFGKNTEEDIIWDIAKNCIGKLGLEDCVIYLFDNKQENLLQKAAYGPKNPVNFEIYKPIVIPKGKGIVGTVAKTGVAEVIENTSDDIRYIVDDECRLSEITVPIIYNSEILGVIDSEHAQRAFYRDWHLQILTAIANLCANKIYGVRIKEKLQEKEQKLALFQEKIEALKNQKQSFRLPLSSTGGTQFFPVEEIIRLEADRNYTILYLTDKRKFVSSKTLKEYEITLTNHQFLRVHKSHLVNQKHIVSLSANRESLILKDASEVEISRRKKEEVYEHLGI